jgi:hypothetical protein
MTKVLIKSEEITSDVNGKSPLWKFSRRRRGKDIFPKLSGTKNPLNRHL